MTHELVCIGCPMGCNLTAEVGEDGTIQVSGNTCKRGEDYAIKELTDPRRIVTSTVRVKGGAEPMVSVKTRTDIPKGLIFQCVSELEKIEVTAPVAIGDVICENVAGCGVSVIATKNVAAAEA